MTPYVACVFLLGSAAAIRFPFNFPSRGSSSFGNIFGSSPDLTPTTPNLSCNCGYTNRGRIVGGKETRANEYPLIAAIHERRSGSHFCGGSIITPWHVLTAAHCTDGYRASDLAVNVGAHALDSTSAGFYDVARIIDHERYDGKEVVNDISLLVTRTQMRFSQTVGPACLPNKRLNIEGETLKALGWGRIKDEGSTSNVLLEVDLTALPFRECLRRWGGRGPRADTNLCSYGVRKDTCQGDSGGPLIWLDPETNRYTLAALVSYGAVCGSGTPAVNTDVSAFVSWINEKVAESKPGSKVCTKI